MNNDPDKKKEKKKFYNKFYNSNKLHLLELNKVGRPKKYINETDEDKKKRQKQYYLDNKEHILKRTKLYQDKFRTQIRDYNKNYYTRGEATNLKYKRKHNYNIEKHKSFKKLTFTKKNGISLAFE